MICILSAHTRRDHSDALEWSERRRRTGRRSPGRAQQMFVPPMSPTRGPALRRRVWSESGAETDSDEIVQPRPPVAPQLLDSGAFRLSVAEVRTLEAQTGLTDEQLLQSLLPHAKALARPPISRFPVGAVAMGGSGRVYVGVNLEFSGLPLNNSVHAEQFLVANARAAGEVRLLSMAVTAAPCGHCRQFFAELPGPGLGAVFAIGRPPRTPSQLLPNRFGPEDLLPDFKSSLLDQGRDARLSLLTPVTHPLALSALDAANRCYSPYTGCPSGVALQTRDGAIHTGGYLECAAYNPSLPPLQAALVAAVAAGARYDDIVAAVIVERMGGAVVQEGSARLLLGIICPGATVQVHACVVRE